MLSNEARKFLLDMRLFLITKVLLMYGSLYGLMRWYLKIEEKKV